jgi:hypothetical protein
MEALQLKDESFILNLSVAKQSGDGNFIAFLQKIQNNPSCTNLSVVTIGEAVFLLLQSEYDAFLVKIDDASSHEYGRFFANIKFFIDSERDLPMLLHHLPIEPNNIHDYRLAKSLIPKFKSDFSTPFFKISQINDNIDINFAYIKNLLTKGFETSKAWNLVERKLIDEDKYEIYQSMIHEKFKRINLYNGGNFSEISDLYNILSDSSQKTFSQAYSMLKDVASQQKMPISSIITISAIEALCLRNAQSFEDITGISGFNKKVVHNAIIRRLMGLFLQNNFSIKRNRPIEMALDTLLTIKSMQHGIEKNLIASKHDIIACLNGNLNVDFLKGWKKSIFGDCVLNFLQGKSSIEAKDMQLFIVQK